MVTEAPEQQQRERWISPHALLGATSVGSASMTTAGLLAGPAGVATVTAAGVLAAGGIAAVRRFAPGAAEKLGLRKPDKAGKGKDSKGKSKSDGAGVGRGKGGLGRLGLMGGNRRGNAGTTGGQKRGGGLLGMARNIAGKGAGLAKRGANAAAKKGAGLLGSKDPTRKNTRGRNTSGPGARNPRGAGGPGGRGRGAGSGPGRGNGAGGKNTGGKDRGSKRRGWGSRIGRTAAGLAGWGARRLFGPKRPAGSDPTAAAPDGKKPKDKTKRTRGSGLLGGGRGTERTPESARPKDRKKKPRKDRTKNTPLGPGPRPGITAGKPDRSGRHVDGGPMPDPFVSRREAITGAAPLEINKAGDVADYVKHAPDYAEAQARGWLRDADTIVEKVNLNPDFTDALKGFAHTQLAAVQAVREYGEVFERSHAEKLRRTRDRDPREAMWDVGRHGD